MPRPSMETDMELLLLIIVLLLLFGGGGGYLYRGRARR
jgi:hypothetical protein